MNDPEYILVDVFTEVIAAVKTALNLPVLNAQYGYIDELRQTLANMDTTAEHEQLKFPCVWLKQPFTIIRGRSNALFGEVEGGADIFIMQQTSKTLKAAGRMATTFKPVIYPIYRELLVQINAHIAISDQYNRAHKFTDRYWWGEEQQKQIQDVVDCSQISGLQLEINNNPNCSPTFNLI
jgi:hypothetical protein